MNFDEPIYCTKNNLEEITKKYVSEYVKWNHYIDACEKPINSLRDGTLPDDDYISSTMLKNEIKRLMDLLEKETKARKQAEKEAADLRYGIEDNRKVVEAKKIADEEERRRKEAGPMPGPSLKHLLIS